MKNNADKYAFVYDNKSNSWFVISKPSDKYKFYGKVRQEIREKNENKIENVS